MRYLTASVLALVVAGGAWLYLAADSDQSLSEDPGVEIAYLLFPPSSGKNSLDDLGENDRVAIDGPKSERFWNAIVEVKASDGSGRSKWTRATLTTDGLSVARALGRIGLTDAILLVGHSENPDLVGLLDAGWELGRLRDQDLDRTITGGAVRVTDGASREHKGYGYRAVR